MMFSPFFSGGLIVCGMLYILLAARQFGFMEIFEVFQNVSGSPALAPVYAILAVMCLVTARMVAKTKFY